MMIFRSLEDIPEDFGPSAVTVGKFDGVHLGHRAVIGRLLSVAHAERLSLTRELLRIRREKISPLLPAMTTKGQATFETGRLTAEWPAGRATLMLLANLSDTPKPLPPQLQWGEPVWNGVPPATLPPWSVYAAVMG